MRTDEPGSPGPQGDPDDRAALNSRASDRDRERQSAEALRHLAHELAELIDLRGRVATAKAILARGGDRQAALDVLNGTQSQPGQDGGA